MSSHERPDSNPIEPFEQQDYTDFMEQWDKLMTLHEVTMTMLKMTVDGTMASTFDEGVEIVITSKYEYIEALETFTETVFDTIEREEAVNIWSHVIDQLQKERLEFMRDIDTRARFKLMPFDEITNNANAYAKGRERARADALLQTVSPADSDESPVDDDPISMERLYEVLEDSEKDWDDLSAVSEGDEYAEWVFDELVEDLDSHINAVLDLCPRERNEDPDYEF